MKVIGDNMNLIVWKDRKQKLKQHGWRYAGFVDGVPSYEAPYCGCYSIEFLKTIDCDYLDNILEKVDEINANKRKR
jgi:hypothetical protein